MSTMRNPSKLPAIARLPRKATSDWVTSVGRGLLPMWRRLRVPSWATAVPAIRASTTHRAIPKRTVDFMHLPPARATTTTRRRADAGGEDPAAHKYRRAERCAEDYHP